MNLKLLKCEHYEKGIWYFTTKYKAAQYIGTFEYWVNSCLRAGKKCKGWTLEWVNGENVIYKYINPTRVENY